MTAPTTPSGSLAAWKIGPALATGNGVVLNPASVVADRLTPGELAAEVASRR